MLISGSSFEICGIGKITDTTYEGVFVALVRGNATEPTEVFVADENLFRQNPNTPYRVGHVVVELLHEEEYGFPEQREYTVINN